MRRMIKPYECTQCGSTEFDDVDSRRVRCVHCGSLFQLLTDEPKVVINKGAKVVFGRHADVDIRGDIDIQSGADVDIQGKVTVRKGKKKQEFTLKLLQAGSKGNNGI